jgi:hypothetical protein
MADSKLGETPVPFTAEEARLLEADTGDVPWRLWGPYLSERQWGTVREDYSFDGDAWSYFTHDHARSRAYRWGEDGIAGVSDDGQRLCLALALWNGADPILKERLFGLTNAEGNHGEDVKEYYFFLDALPTHSYLRELYKYPQQPYPYEDLVATNRARSRDELEYELLDTGIFDDDRYFDIEIEYAKSGPTDLLMRVTAHNRGAEPAPLHILPTLWFRNTWWKEPSSARPTLRATSSQTVRAVHPTLGTYTWVCESDGDLLFCDNETNAERIVASPRVTDFPKDGINDHVVQGRPTVNPARVGTKAAIHRRVIVAPGEAVTVRVRLVEGEVESGASALLGPDFDAVIEQRRAECDQFYESITPEAVSADRRAVMRQALAGMIWSKQYYEYDVDRWLLDRTAPPNQLGAPKAARNASWGHMRNKHVLSMPDTWEYPWYAAWDLAFHVLPLTIVDPAFARTQIELMLSDAYLHPSGQLPAYEWNFGDVNPPVHAYATLFWYFHEKDRTGQGDTDFLRDSFHKLLLVFTWWVNRKDVSGNGVFEGGFLGLDNIGVFDRSHALPTGGHLEQADGSAWMGFFSLNMLEIAIELAHVDPDYEDYVVKFMRHFVQIAAATDRPGSNPDEIWDEEDGFFYDVLRLPDGSATRLKVRSMVGLLPLIATASMPSTVIDADLSALTQEQMQRRPGLFDLFANPTVVGPTGRRLLSAVNEEKLRRVLTRMLDEERFLSPHGIRALSRWHLEHPYEFTVHGETFTVAYEPADSRSGMFGGNSNWRGPVWMPVNAILIRSLTQFASYFGDTFTIEYPTGSGNQRTLTEIAVDLSERAIRIFTKDDQGHRPVYGETERFQTDPRWRDLILFYEYFHGDNGAGIGASHQTGWTGLVANYIQIVPQFEAGTIDLTHQWPMAMHYRRPLA